MFEGVFGHVFAVAAVLGETTLEGVLGEVFRRIPFGGAGVVFSFVLGDVFGDVFGMCL